jgi:hypothetical protein
MSAHHTVAEPFGATLSQPAKLGELVDYADAVPIAKLAQRASFHLRAIGPSFEAVDIDPGRLRHLTVAALLMTRIVFERHRVPRDREFKIGRASA